MGLNDDIVTLAVVAALAILTVPATTAAGEADDRATLQERYASTDGHFYVHATGDTMVRDDFYRTFGLGVDAGYFFGEDWAVELRGHHHFTSLSHTGRQMADDHQLVPDMRAPERTVAIGGRLSWGYGKILALRDSVVHFDPQFIAHGGITRAEERIVPMVSGGIGVLTHWRWGIQAKLDLQFTFHFERRDRGPVVATGFAPLLGVGWSISRGDSE